MWQVTKYAKLYVQICAVDIIPFSDADITIGKQLQYTCDFDGNTYSKNWAQIPISDTDMYRECD